MNALKEFKSKSTQGRKNISCDCLTTMYYISRSLWLIHKRDVTVVADSHGAHFEYDCD